MGVAADDLQPPHHLVHELRAGGEPAQGVLPVAADNGLVPADPVVLADGVFNALQVAAEGHVLQGLAAEFAAVAADLPLGQEAAPPADEARGVSRTGEDAGRKILRIPPQVGPGDEAAHAVSQEDPGNTGEFLPHPLVQGLLVPDDLLPAVLLREPAQLGVVLHAQTVAKMVVAHGGEAVGREKAREVVVAADMLRHAVHQLHHPADRTVGGPQTAVDGVLSAGGGEAEITDLSHGKSLLCVI